MTWWFVPRGQLRPADAPRPAPLRERVSVGVEGGAGLLAGPPVLRPPPLRPVLAVPAVAPLGAAARAQPQRAPQRRDDLLRGEARPAPQERGVRLQAGLGAPRRPAAAGDAADQAAVGAHRAPRALPLPDPARRPHVLVALPVPPRQTRRCSSSASYFWEFYYGAHAGRPLRAVLDHIGHRRARRVSQRLAPRRTRGCDASRARARRLSTATSTRTPGSATGAPCSRSTQRLREPPRLGDWPAAQRQHARVPRPDPRLGPNPASEPHSPTTFTRRWFRGAKAERTSTGATREAWRRRTTRRSGGCRRR